MLDYTTDHGEPTSGDYDAVCSKLVATYPKLCDHDPADGNPSGLYVYFILWFVLHLLVHM